VGAEAAAPILFEIFEMLSGRDDAGWFDRPAKVGQRSVCSVSGKNPGDLCEMTISELYIPGVSPEAKCDIHKEIILDAATGFRLCRFCATGKSIVAKTFEVWDPKTSTWLLKTGRISGRIPEHNPSCTGTSSGDRPVIISPNEDILYIIREHLSPQQQGIMLDASVASGTKNIYWFVDGDLFGKAKPGQKLFLIPRRGIHELTCSDDRGRSTTIKIEIL
jgi:penicillin-binding protein 1C